MNNCTLVFQNTLWFRGTVETRTFFTIKTPHRILKLILLSVGLIVSSCGGDPETSDDLSKQDKEFIKKLGILDDQENIILFDSQGGGFNALKTSGNFFTDRRIASYWIDSRDTTKTC
jgi:hypothetical protein